MLVESKVALVCPFVTICFFLICLSLHPSVPLTISLTVLLFKDLPVCLSVFLSVCLAVCLFNHSYDNLTSYLLIC
jgi:hypothetical protein